MIRDLAVNLIFALINITLFLVVPAGIIVLQIYLSKRSSKWPGLILPIASFIALLLIIFGSSIFYVTSYTTSLLLTSCWSNSAASTKASSDAARRGSELLML